ncbi:MAG: bifunctional glycosyltransferase family 2/GtrA family protein [Patescibacteria group bacterium]|nr:glycosyltransferase [Patescibacteria group bacterium]MDE1944494.1 bifunctional glycosyltransferase family 2/GtrA family protein [Patescibacteria group bacterium]MDE1944980.1 bifunctional glycosyltransferase family 2/GtrA family protein [Patescibacteria group bacterium]MDE2057403.1 bifunctional glycosyltransferase family 2/GtrA family protein [Patescibacteria group bacterium]
MSRTPLDPISLSVFFPIHNERENLPELISETETVLSASPLIERYEIILVDDGSTDGSGELADAYALADRRIRAVHHAGNRGYGEALKTGLAAARLDYIFFTDADRQFDIVELAALLAHLPGHEAVIGYRAPRRDPAMRLVNAWGWNVLNRLLFGLKVRDIDCAFKLFARDAVRDLPLASSGAMASAEILIRLKDQGARIKEVPVSHAPRTKGRATGAKPSVIYRALAEMLALYRNGLGAEGRQTRDEALKFVAVGVVNTLIDALAYIALTRGVPAFAAHLLVAKFLSFFAGTVSSLLLNRSWTFGIRTRLSAGEVARFYAMTSLSIAVNVYLMDVFVSLGLYDLYALAITTVATFAINFTLSKFWVFRKKPLPLQERYAA